MANKIFNGRQIPNVLVAMAPDSQPGLLRQKELARLLGVSSRTIDNLKFRKAIPVIRISDRCVRFHLGSVLQALRRYEIQEVGR